jgi:hypothetical protein
MINQMMFVLLQYQSYGRSSQSGPERMLMGALSVGLFYLIAAIVRGAKKKVKGKDFEKVD